MPPRRQTRRGGVTEIGDDSTSAPTHRRSPQICQATGDPAHRSRRLNSTQRVDDVATAVTIVAALVFLIILPGFGFWRLLWAVLLGFWRLLWAVFLGFWQLLWGVELLCSWLVGWVALPCSWLVDWVLMPVATIFGLIALGRYVVDWVRDRAEVAPPSYPSNDTTVGDTAPTTTGRGGEEGTDRTLTEEFANLGGPKEYSYEDLSKATNSFASGGQLGEGGFGVVYEGYIGDARTRVAVKVISSDSIQGLEAYKREVQSMSQLSHRNLVRLLGYCHEATKFVLVYEFVGGGTLYDHLFKGRTLLTSPLTWTRRYNIARGLASALSYLQKQCHECVIHRDIKSSNVMLDEKFEAKLGDFGLAKLVDHTRDPSMTEPIGTVGYCDPEYFQTGIASKESDIYSFGVVLLEIVCGRKAVDQERDPPHLVEWVQKQYGPKKLLSAVVDEKLGRDFDRKQAEALMTMGLQCAHRTASSRPSIEWVMGIFNSTAKPPELPSKMPGF